MITYALGFAFICFGLAILLNVIQMFRAPSIVDRILVLDTMTVNALALLILYGVATMTAINFEAALLFSMTSFVATVSFCKYLLRGSIIE